MKNTIIAILSFVCIFLIANTIGVFDFMSLSNHDETIVFRQKREKGVNSSATYKFAYLYNEKDPSERSILHGYEDVFEQVNKIADKKFELIKEPNIVTLADYNRALQKYNDDFTIAAVLGPTHSGFIMSARALASMYAMPLLSADTFRSEHLAPLEFDTYQPMYPVLEEWVGMLGKHIDQNPADSKKLLIVSPEKGTFGDFFATIMERFSTIQMNINGIYRLNYTDPLKVSELVDSMKFFSSEKDICCILYTGDFLSFDVFYGLVEKYFPNAVIYGHDSIYVDEIFEGQYKNKIYLPRLNVTADEEFIQNFKNKYGKEPSYASVTARELVFSAQRVLKKLKKYDVSQFLTLFRQEVENFHANNKLSVQLVNPD